MMPPGMAKGPWGIDVDQVERRVYVAGLEDPYRLAVINATTREVIANVQLTGDFPHAVAVYSDLNRVYVTNTGGPKISVVDTDLFREITTIPACSSPVAICVNPSTGLVYVACDVDNCVQVIDASSNTSVDTITVGALPYGICVNPVTNRIYTANLSESTVSVIDGYTNQVIATIAVGAYPRGICVDPLRNLIYVAERDDNSVSVIDGSTNQVIATIPVGAAPHNICVDSVRNMIHVVCAGSRLVYAIDGSNDVPIDSVEVGRDPVGGIAIDPDSNEIYVTNYGSNDISVVDGATIAAVATIRLAFYAREVAVDQTGRRWYVTNWLGNNVRCYEPATATLVWDQTVGYSPGEIRACNSVAGVTVDRLYVTLPDTNTLVVLDLATGNPLDTLIVGSSPRGVTVNEVTDRLYVANNASRSVSVLEASTGTSLETIAFPWSPLDVEVNHETNMIYVTTWMGMLYAVDGATNTITDSICLSGTWEPNYIAINEQTNRIYVTGLNTTEIWVVNGTELTVEADLPTTDFPDQVAVSEVLGRAYVATDRYLTVIDPDNTIGESVWLIKLHGRGCAVDAESSFIYVGCPEDESVILLYDEAIASVQEPHEGSSPRIVVSPSPFGNSTSICVYGPGLSNSHLAIFDIEGRLVRMLTHGSSGYTHPYGRQMTLTWDGTDTSGKSVAPGIYLIILEAPTSRIVSKACKLR